MTQSLQIPFVAHLAALGFERELLEELGSDAFESHGRLILAHPRHESPAWAQVSWLNPREIAISSIGDAAKKLRELGPWWWSITHEHHRRAQLIQAQLPKLKIAPLDFLGALPDRALGAWTLLAPDRMLASPLTSSPFPEGAVTFHESKVAPSRAYLKLWDLFTVFGVRPQRGERCLELGASPGGWTWVLAQLGCTTVAVDRAPLADHVARMKNVEFIQGNAFTLKPRDVGAIDWLFSDLICYPQQLEKLVNTWLESGLCRNFVCTIKFKSPTDHATAQRLRAIGGANLIHLSHNKHELTWWLMR